MVTFFTFQVLLFTFAAVLTLSMFSGLWFFQAFYYQIHWLNDGLLFSSWTFLAVEVMERGE
ncbi:hypothetical protein QQP08_000162 [Theobroma cacao]|nr:hypothetical protein QQP08_000162 [Theobroma cacao]